MRSLVTAHPDIAIAPETHFLRLYADSADPSFEEVWRTYSVTHRFKDLALDADTTKQLIIESEDCSARNVFRTMLREFARRQGKDRWGEKTPSHYAYVEELLEWFPQARVIWIVRDPRAVCNSLLSVWWRRWDGRGLRAFEGTVLTRLRRIYFDAKVWQRHLHLLRATWYDDERVRCIKYEDLVGHPRLTMQEVGEFLDEEFPDHIVTSRSWSDLSMVPAESLVGRRGRGLRAHLAQAIKPIGKESIDKWRGTLTRHEARMIENVCKEGMRWLEYETECPEGADSLGRIEAIAAQCWGFSFWAIHEGWRRYGTTS